MGRIVSKSTDDLSPTAPPSVPVIHLVGRLSRAAVETLKFFDTPYGRQASDPAWEPSMQFPDPYTIRPGSLVLAADPPQLHYLAALTLFGGTFIHCDLDSANVVPYLVIGGSRCLPESRLTYTHGRNALIVRRVEGEGYDFGNPNGSVVLQRKSDDLVADVLIFADDRAAPTLDETVAAHVAAATRLARSFALSWKSVTVEVHPGVSEREVKDAILEAFVSASEP